MAPQYVLEMNEFTRFEHEIVYRPMLSETAVVVCSIRLRNYCLTWVFGHMERCNDGDIEPEKQLTSKRLEKQHKLLKEEATPTTVL